MNSPSDKTKIETSAVDDSSLHLTLHRRRRPEPTAQAMVASRFRECRKNHAARLGRVALDGCREFMPSTDEDAAAAEIPGFLTCAACGCHRNFHRRDYWPHPGPVQSQSPGSPGPLSPIPTAYYAPVPLMLRAPVNWNGGSPEPTMTSLSDGDRRSPGMEVMIRRKRERTKFSKEQKEKMEEFAEKVGWKMKRSNEKVVEEFCKEVGVSRVVLKIWMNNHKQKKLISI